MSDPQFKAPDEKIRELQRERDRLRETLQAALPLMEHARRSGPHSLSREVINWKNDYVDVIASFTPTPPPHDEVDRLKAENRRLLQALQEHAPDCAEARRSTKEGR